MRGCGRRDKDMLGCRGSFREDKYQETIEMFLWWPRCTNTHLWERRSLGLAFRALHIHVFHSNESHKATFSMRKHYFCDDCLS